MGKNKKQHYVPEFYLKAWCDPDAPQGYEPYLWLATKNGIDIRPKAPSNIFHETDLYTIVLDGKRNLSTEKSLAQIEGEFAEVRREKLEKQLPLNTYEKVVVCAFASAMYSRTIANRERWRPFWNDLRNQLEDKVNRMTAWFENATPEQLKEYIPSIPLGDNPTVTFKEINDVADEPLKSMISAQLNVLLPVFLNLDCAIIKTSTTPGFITSDDPCVWLDPQLPNYPNLAGTALMSPTIEIHLPISPSQCIYFNRRGNKGYINLSSSGVIEENFTVAKANRRTCAKAHQYVVVNKKILLEKWFVSG
jgi:hypothetical protein